MKTPSPQKQNNFQRFLLTYTFIISHIKIMPDESQQDETGEFYIFFLTRPVKIT